MMVSKQRSRGTVEWKVPIVWEMNEDKPRDVLFLFASFNSAASRSGEKVAPPPAVA